MLRHQRSMSRFSFNRRAISTLVVVLIALAFSGQRVAAQDTAEKPLTIVAFGDSTTALRPTVKQVYADRLPKLLEASGIASKVINAGVGGSHTGHIEDNALHKRQHALDRFQTAVRDHHPQVVIVQFGWNDSWVDTGGEESPSRIPLENYRKNLRHIIDTLHEDGAQVILMTPNRPRNTMEAWRVQRTERYVQAVRELAAELDVPLVDVWAAYAEYDAVDGQSVDDLLVDEVHPGDQGHALVARQLATIIPDLLP